MLSRLRGKHLHLWIPAWLRHVARRVVNRPAVAGERHLLFAFCDHFEPGWDGAALHTSLERVRVWRRGYPALARDFRDGDGRPPRHSFFFPGDQYHRDTVDALGELVSSGLGEVELHLHHDGDTAATLRRRLAEHVGQLAGHGHLARDPGGRPRFAFIHGNWCLANARRDGRWCGVDAELPLLFESGCYADFTFPAAPDESQPPLVNRIYWPAGDTASRRAQDRGVAARVGQLCDDRLLIIQGPLALARRPGRLRVRVENAAITDVDPPTPERVDTWVDQHIHVLGRPEWVFVKVHTHGAPEHAAQALLGKPGRQLHDALARLQDDGRGFRLHYVTAREMYNIAVAAMAGATGDPGRYRDFTLPPPPAAGGRTG